MPRLVLTFDDRVLCEFGVDSEVTIGRLPDNTIVIDNPAVSGHHARVFFEGDDCIVEDLRSKNGTYVNEKHVLRAALQDHDQILIGKHKLLFDELSTAESSPNRRIMPTLGGTEYLNTKSHRAMLAKLREERGRSRQ